MLIIEFVMLMHRKSRGVLMFLKPKQLNIIKLKQCDENVYLFKQQIVIKSIWKFIFEQVSR